MHTFEAEIAAQGEDKILGPLTLNNLIGAGVGGLVVWAVLSLIGVSNGVVQTIGVVVGVAVGVFVTIRWNGISLMDRLGLWVAYRLRVLSGDHRIVASREAVGSVVPHALDSLVVEDLNGNTVLRPYDPQRDEQRGRL